MLVQKTIREFEYDRKLTLNSAKRKKRNNSPHRKMYIRASPKGPGKIRLDGGEDEDIIETDWVAAVDSRPELGEMPLVDLMKPGKIRRRGQKGSFLSPYSLRGTRVYRGHRAAGDFEVVPNMLSVIVLDDNSASEPEVIEPWEELDFDDDDQDAHANLSYAEVAASTT